MLGSVFLNQSNPSRVLKNQREIEEIRKTSVSKRTIGVQCIKES